jgi:hypothetical protein
VARLIYDHLLVAVVAVIPVVLFLRARRRR